jgi:hypothetical protein
MKSSSGYTVLDAASTQPERVKLRFRHYSVLLPRQ